MIGSRSTLPLLSSPSRRLQTWSAQTLRQGLHSNCHFRSVTHVNVPFLPPSPPLSCVLVSLPLPLHPHTHMFSSFLVFFLLSFFHRDLPHSILVASFLGLIHILWVYKDKSCQPDVGCESFWKDKIHLAVFLVENPYIIVSTRTSFDSQHQIKSPLS